MVSSQETVFCWVSNSILNHGGYLSCYWVVVQQVGTKNSPYLPFMYKPNHYLVSYQSPIFLPTCLDIGSKTPPKWVSEVKVETPIFHPQPSHNWHPVDDVPIHHGCCVHSGPIHPLSFAFFITTLLLYYLPNPNQPNPTQPTNHCMRALVMSELVGKMRS